MRPATPALAAFLAAKRNAVVVDLYTFSLAGGMVLRYTAGNLPLAIPATSFADANSLNYGTSGTRNFAVGPRFGRSKVTTKIGVEPTELDIAVYAGPNDLIGSFTWPAAVEAGFFDGATVELDRFVMPPGGDGVAGPVDTSLGAVVWFYGRVGEVEAGRSSIAVKVKSLLNLIARQQMPRRLYQSSCTHVFGDAMCGYDRVNGRNAAVVATGAGATTITAIAGSSQTDIVVAAGVAGYYGFGTCTGLTGANAGISRGIISVATPTVIGLMQPFPFPIAAGDTFQLLPGCDHNVIGTCRSPFNNLARFGGMPFIPPPEYAV